jgi:PAS domain S-box-containing protein
MAKPSRAPRRHTEDALSHAPIAVHEVDLQGYVVWVNRAASSLLGLPAEDILGRPAWEFLVEEEREPSRQSLLRKLASEETLESYELTCQRPDGRRLVVEVQESYRRDEAGAIVGLRCFLVDVTLRKRACADLASRMRERTQELELAVDFLRREIDERRMAEEEHHKLEAQLRHTQRLESMGVFAGGIAHEFNNLLTSIIGYASLAGQDMTLGSPAGRHIDRALAAARSAADLTRQILAYAGHSQFTPEPVDVSTLVETSLRLMESLVSKKAVFQLDLAREAPRIEADAGQMRQVVLNLVSNASDALADQPGEIRVSTGLYWAAGGELPSLRTGRIMPAGLYVYLEVADTGAGMDRETIDRIFDPFFSTKFTGRGLGLAAVLGIVRGHRGSITVASRPGKGSTFRAWFPALADEEPASRETAAADAPVAATPATGTVLVVDDEEPIRFLARAVLEVSGFTVLTASDGAEALRIFANHGGEIHAVLLDVVMPGLDAAEVVTEIQLLKPEVRVVVSSGFNQQETAGRLGGMTPSAFLHKPYDPAELVARLRAVW